jgi:hypothetical protein
MDRLSQGFIVHLKDDETKVIRLRYVGAGTVTSVTVTTATDITMVTSDGGTDAYLFATYTTVGTLTDAINADGIFVAKVVDALRSDATASKFVTGAITSAVEDGVVIWDVKRDTSTALKTAICVTPDRGFALGAALAAKKRTELVKFVYNQNVSAAEAGAVKVYKRRGSTETLIASWPSVDATTTTVFDTSAGDFAFTAKQGEEIIVSVQDATSITDGAANFIEAWYAVV